MRPYLHKTPTVLKWLYPNRVWSIDTTEKIVYLTFDDGPHPEATSFALEELRKYEASATFFVVGNNVTKYPETFEQLLDAGHTIGNHTFNHLNGLRCSTQDYVDNANRCQEVIAHVPNVTNLFRPPYGRMSAGQARLLAGSYSIIMWDYLVGDFDLTQVPEKCTSRALHNLKGGSVVLFHDSRKSFNMMKEILPVYLESLYASGYRVEKLPNAS